MQMILLHNFNYLSIIEFGISGSSKKSNGQAELDTSANDIPTFPKIIAKNCFILLFPPYYSSVLRI